MQVSQKFLSVKNIGLKNEDQLKFSLNYILVLLY